MTGRVKLLIEDKKLGTKATATDFAYLCGVRANKWGYVPYLLQTMPSRLGRVYTVDDSGTVSIERMDCVTRGVRLKRRIPKDVKIVDEVRGVPVVEYGLFPRGVLAGKQHDELNTLLQGGELKQVETSLSFIGDFVAQSAVYQYGDSKYFSSPVYSKTLFGEPKSCGYSLFAKYEPMRWLLDENSGLMITEKVVFSGFAFDESEKLLLDFENAQINEVVARIEEECCRAVDGTIQRSTEQKIVANKAPEVIGKLQVLGALSTVLDSCVVEKLISRDAGQVIQKRMGEALSRES